MSGEHSNSEWSEGDREGSRGGSLQARRSRRSDPFDRTTSQQTTLLSKTGFRPVFSCAPLLLLFPKKLTLFGDPCSLTLAQLRFCDLQFAKSEMCCRPRVSALASRPDHSKGVSLTILPALPHFCTYTHYRFYVYAPIMHLRLCAFSLELDFDINARR